MDHPQETVEAPGLKWKDVSTLLPKWEARKKREVQSSAILH